MAITTPTLDVLPAPGLLIGADLVTDTTGGTHQHRYPASGHVTSEVPLAGAHEVDLAVRAAQKAQPQWASMPPPERRRLLLKYADLVESEATLFGDLATIDNGTPRGPGDAYSPAVAELLRYNAGWTDRIGGSVIPVWPGHALDYTLQQPLGVIGIIIPWNGPLISCGMTMGPALAAGNAVVIKPPELTPYSASRLGQLALEAGIPPGVVNIVPGGAEAGEALVRHRGIAKIHFTGSGATAKHVLTGAMDNLTPVGLELGGKSANIVFDDVDIEASLTHLLWGVMLLSGQGCINPTRLLVQDSIYEAVVDAAAAMLGQIPVGDPLDRSTVMGPVVNQASCDRILGMIDRSTEGGARIVTGGERLGGDLADGYFISPTVVADVDNSSYIAQNEVFGPVLSVLPFTDEDEAVRMANDTPFGLAAYIETNDLRRAHRVAERIQAGNIWVNGFSGIPVAAPFGGWKSSGHGRLGGRHGIEEFTQPKNIWVNLE